MKCKEIENNQTSIAQSGKFTLNKNALTKTTSFLVKITFIVRIIECHMNVAKIIAKQYPQAFLFEPLKFYFKAFFIAMNVKIRY